MLSKGSAFVLFVLINPQLTFFLTLHTSWEYNAECLSLWIAHLWQQCSYSRSSFTLSSIQSSNTLLKEFWTTKATLQITIISMSNHPQNVQTLARTNVLTHLALLLNHLQKDKMSIQMSTADSTKPLDPN